MARIVRGAARSVAAHPLLFAGAAVTLLGVHVLLPPVLLSLARKPCDYFAFNAWLVNLPGYLVSDGVPIGVKAAKLWNLALFWFSASNPYGTEWGFAVDTGDLVRMVAASLLIATYLALWHSRRDREARAPAALAPRHVASSGAGSGVLGGLASMLGLTTGSCSVMGCGAPVMPVVGLAFAGLSSTTLALLASVASWSAPVVLTGLGLAVAWRGWAAGADRT